MGTPWAKLIFYIALSGIVTTVAIKKHEQYRRREALRSTLTSKSPLEIREMIIDERFMHYHRNCPCPYDTDSAGNSCGYRSAYDRRYGRSPYCYPEDISDRAVQSWIDRKVEEVN